MLSTRLSAFGLLAFGLSWLASDHYRPWVNFHSEALALLGLLSLVSGWLLDRHAPNCWPAITRWLLIAATLPWLWWGLGVGAFAGDALISSLYVLALAAAVAVGYGWGRQPDLWLAALAWTMGLVAVLSATIGLVQWLTLTNSLGMYVVQADPGDRAMGNLGQPNQLGTLLLMGMAGLVYLFEVRRLGCTAFATSVCFLTLGLIPTQSRSALLSVAVVTVWLVAKRSRLTRLRSWHLLIWASVVLLLTVALPTISEMLLLGGGRGVASMTHTSDRLAIWHQVVAGIAEAPWFGYGWNQTPTAHAFGAASVPGTMTFSYAHNLVLDLAAWNGIPLGLFLMSVLIVWTGSRAVAAQVPAAVAAFAGLLPLGIHSMVEFPFAYAYFLVLGGLLVGVIEASHPGSRNFRLRRGWALALVLPWTLVGAYMCIEYLKIEEDFRVVRFENMHIGQTPAEYAPPDVWMLTHMAEMLKAARVRPAPGMSSEQIERLRKVALRFPWGALHMRYTYALALNGDPVGAARQMRIVRGMFGDVYYAAAKAELLELLIRYPKAAQVPLS